MKQGIGHFVTRSCGATVTTFDETETVCSCGATVWVTVNGDEVIPHVRNPRHNVRPVYQYSVNYREE